MAGRIIVHSAYNSGVVIAAFGEPWSIRPNVSLAKSGLECATTGDHLMPIFTQTDIKFNNPHETLDVTYMDQAPGSPPPTLRIMRGAVEWAKAKRLTRLYLICAFPHRKRCIRDLNTAISEAGGGITVRLWPIESEEYSFWFTKDSTQPRTTSLRAWLPRELLLNRWFFWPVYKKVAA